MLTFPPKVLLFFQIFVVRFIVVPVTPAVDYCSLVVVVKGYIRVGLTFFFPTFPLPAFGACRQDYYGGGYGHPPPIFNAYGQPMGGYGHPHMGMAHHPGSAEVLPPNVQMRLDHLVSTGFCYPTDIDDRSVGFCLCVEGRLWSRELQFLE